MATITETGNTVVDVVDVITWPGPGIQVPEGMPLDRLIEALVRKQREDQEIVDVQGLVPCSPMDGAIAFQKALRREGGFAHQIPTGFPPRRNQVQVVVDAQGTAVTVPWGQFEAPFFEGTLGCGTGYDDYGRVAFQVTGRIKGMYRTTFERIVERTKQIVRDESIYRGKALHLDHLHDEMARVRFLDVAEAPKPIYPALIEDQVMHDFLSSITHAEVVRDLNGHLKRGVLLAGEYGVGKTMLARYAARLAQEHGFTFGLCPDPNMFPQAVDFLRPYLPAVLFVEDVEQIAGVERTEQVNALLNKLDGVDTKADDLVVVFTTNHLDKINAAMRRPGRIDLTLVIPAPDAEAALRIAFGYAHQNVATDDDFGPASEALAGMIPAVIAEAVKRAVMREAVRTNGTSRLLRADSLLQAAHWIQNERNVGRPGSGVDPMDRFTGSLVGRIVDALPSALAAVSTNGHS